MPEGHTVHRTALQFGRAFANQPLQIDSPQGRFAAGARLLSGQSLVNSYAVGKQLFLEFADGQTLRIHLGIYGKWRWFELNADAELPEIEGQIRARFWTTAGESTTIAELRGPTACEILNPIEVEQVLERLGADPLRPDPESSQLGRFVAQVGASNRSIGALLMDQRVVSGIGNVYRAELLFRAGLNPHRPGKSMPIEQLEDLWRDAVLLMQDGVTTGVMITRNEHLGRDPGKAERHFVYKREGQPCRNCQTHVVIEILNTRKLYWCPSCQR